MKMKSWHSWSRWMVFENSLDIPEDPGVYIIAAKQPIDRIFGQDPLGILSIGETDNLLKRIQMFWSCANGERHRGHTAGWRFRELDMHTQFPLSSLQFRFKSASTKEQAYSLEGQLLKEYARQHLELPPLNYKYNWSDHGN